MANLKILQEQHMKPVCSRPLGSRWLATAFGICLLSGGHWKNALRTFGKVLPIELQSRFRDAAKSLDRVHENDCPNETLPRVDNI